MIKDRYHKNENISGANLLLVPFRFNSKKLEKCFDVVCISVLILCV